MREVHVGLFVGSELECHENRQGWATVHACKSPCHQRAVGYRGNLPTDHPHYLVYEEPGNLYLNMIDPPIPLFKPPLFTEFLRFAVEARSSGEDLLIHCNQGLSRAPSLALMYLAKVEETISDQSYEVAKNDYLVIDPRYQPGRGIEQYLGEHWEEF